MKNSFLEKQANTAKNTYNYFFMQLITKILKELILIAIFLLLNVVFDIIIINIITLLITVYFVYNIYKTFDNYNYILNDIRNNFKDIDFSIAFNFDVLKNNIYEVVKYGK